MKIILALLALAVAHAANIPLTVGPITSTRAVVRYTPTGGICTYTATASLYGKSYAPDTSNLAAITNGDGSVSVQFGTGSGLAALPAGQSVTATVACGADSGAATFSTQPLPVGNTYTTPPPFNSAKFGNYDWPIIDWADQGKVYVDPMRGTSLKRAITPGWYGKMQDATNFGQWSGGAGWTNPANALKGTSCDGTAGNCTQTSSTNKVFLSFGSEFGQIGGTNGFSAGYNSLDTYDDFIVLLKGLGSDSNSSNRQVNVCLTYFDSATCNSAVRTITLPSNLGTAGFPANTSSAWASTAAFGFPEWGGTAPQRNDFALAFGSVSVTGGVNVALTSTAFSFQYFNTKWQPGAMIYIAGSGCTDGGSADVCKIASVADPEHLTLQNPGNNVSNASYRSMASGVLIWKASASGSITFGASYGYAWSPLFNVPGEGDFQICNPNALSVDYEADGTTPISPAIPGNLCFIKIGDPFLNGGVLFLLLPSRGETRLLSPLYTPPGVNTGAPAADQNSGLIAFAPQSWDASSPTDIYGYGPVSSGTKYSIFRARYDTAKHFKAYSHPLYAIPAYAPGQDTSQFWFNGPRWSDDPMIYTNITPPSTGKDVLAQIVSSNPLHDSSVYSNLSIALVLNGYAIFTENGGSQDSIAVISAFNLATGLLSGYGDTFSTFPVRWGGLHSTGVSNSAGYLGMALNALGGASGFQPAINTTIAASISSGSQTVTPASMSGIAVNRPLWIDTGGNGEQVIVTAAAGSTFTATFANSHTGPVTVKGQTVVGLGPHQFTPYSVWKSGAFSTDTSLTSTMDACSSYGLPQWIIDLGASGNKCMKFRTQDVCSHYPATAAEKTKWPCPSNPSYSQLQGLAAGDEVGITAFSGPQELDLVAAVAPVTDSGCGVNCVEVVMVRGWQNSNQTDWSSGWTAYTVPGFQGCAMNGCTPGVGAWVLPSVLNMNTTWLIDPQAFAAHADFGAAPVDGNATSVQASIAGIPYRVRYNQPLSAQAGSFAGANSISSDGPFHGVAPSTTMQSYPSNEQLKAPASERKQFFDIHAMNGALGFNGSDVKAGIDPVTYDRVSGTTSVYRFTSLAGGIPPTVANYKIRPPVVYAGRWILRDVSGPATGDVVTDATPWTYCFAANANECRSGSSVGQIYASIPNVPAVMPNCYTTWLTENLPCALFPSTSAAQMVEMDASQSYSNFEHGRILSMGLTGYGRQYQMSPLIPESTGTWGLYKADWLDGMRSEMMLLSIPAWNDDGVSRRDFQNLQVPIPAGNNYAEVRFGYADYGAPDQLRCTWRQEACNTSAPTGTVFNFESEARTLTSCSSGCTINVPVLPDHIVYYRTRASSDGNTWTDGPLNVATATGVAGPNCADLTFSPSNHTSPAGGDTGSLSVTVTDQACAWIANSSTGWLNITSGGSGTGNGAINWSVLANAGVQRNATIASGSASFTLTQSGCTLSINPTFTNYTETGGAANVSITASSQSCTWTASSPAGWVTVGPANGTGNGSVTVTAAANSGGARNASLTIAGQIFAVTEDAASVCSFSINPTFTNYTEAGGAANISITASSPSCAWTATSPAGWVTINPPTGVGSGSVTVTAVANGGSARSAGLTIAGQSLGVTQDAASVTGPAITGTTIGSGTSLRGVTIQ